MTEEEILRKKLDWLNQNSYYGIMIDTEITSIVRNLIKRLEEKEMNATSVQTIENVKEMHFTIEKSCVDDITKVIVGASTNDDIFEFHFSGEGCVVFADQWFNMVADKAYKADFESERNKRKIMETENSILRRNKKKYEEKIGELEKELGEWKKEASEYLKDVDGVRREKNKEINELKQQLQQAENDKKRLTYKLQENENLKKELALEKAANEAQHKFIREYAGKGTEVQFNYAIDEVKEVSYVIVDKEEYNKNFEKWANAQVENSPASTSRSDILDQAKKCVCGQREQDYGTPESNFQFIADLWNGYLGEKTDNPVISVTPVDVSMMMALMKIARIRNGGGSGDSFVDLAGYAACGGEIWHGQKAKDQN